MNTRSYFRYILGVFIIVFLFISCDKPRFFSSKELGQNIFLETFQTPGGVYADDQFYYYLTDSINFRCFVGSIDEDGYMKSQIEPNNEGVHIKLFRRRGKNYKLDSTYYNVNDLIKNRDWD